MIKLIDILKELNELSLEKGHAGSASSKEILNDNIYFLLPDRKIDKYNEFDSDSRVNNLGQQFVSDVLKHNKVVGSDGIYKMVLAGDVGSGDKYFYLVNTNANLIELAIVGIIKTEKARSLTYNYNLKSAFNLNVYQVHWSNVGIEYRGKGVGKIMYTLVYNHISSIGAALASDSMLFVGSSGMWRTYMPTIASYFGIVANDIIIPVAKEDVSNTSLVEKSNLDGFIAMENPPKLIRKIAYNVEGLSFANGDYGIIPMNIEINDKIELNIKGKRFSDEYQYFDDIVDECSTLNELFGFIKYEIGDTMTSKGLKSLKTAIFAFENVIAVVKQVGDKLVTVYI